MRCPSCKATVESSVIEAKLTDLWAKALVLKDAKDNRAVLITLDLVGIGRQFSQEVCQAVRPEGKVVDGPGFLW